MPLAALAQLDTKHQPQHRRVLVYSVFFISSSLYCCFVLDQRCGRAVPCFVLRCGVVRRRRHQCTGGGADKMRTQTYHAYIRFDNEFLSFALCFGVSVCLFYLC